jgi:hypothetical protein
MKVQKNKNKISPTPKSLENEENQMGQIKSAPIPARDVRWDAPV